MFSDKGEFSQYRKEDGNMEKTTMKFSKVLPVAAVVVLTLVGCGGGGSDSVAATPSNSGSITACFTANSTVNFAVVVSNAPANSVVANRSTVGPMTYNGQAVTGQTLFLPSGSTTYTQNVYWTVTSSGVTTIAEVDPNGTVTVDGMFFPQNMSAGQTATNSKNDVQTFVGFETITLAGRIFSNTCHIKEVDSLGNQTEGWYAPGYGMVKNNGGSGLAWQYNGDL